MRFLQLSGFYLVLLFSTPSTAHFTLNYPSPLGSGTDNEGTAPCGGYAFDASTKLSDFHVDGDAISMITTHPQADILIRGTLDTSASGNWTDLFPVIAQYGLGAFCEPRIKAPASWAGSSGLVQVIQKAIDGMLYQVRGVRNIRHEALLNCKVRPSEVSCRKRIHDPLGLHERNWGHRFFYNGSGSPSGFFAHAFENVQSFDGRGSIDVVLVDMLDDISIVVNWR